VPAPISANVDVVVVDVNLTIAVADVRAVTATEVAAITGGPIRYAVAAPEISPIASRAIGRARTTGWPARARSGVGTVRETTTGSSPRLCSWRRESATRLLACTRSIREDTARR
jgi:hypothetical protein